MSNSDWLLAARILENTDYLVVKSESLEPGQYLIVYAPVPGQVPYDDQVENKLDPFPHFPYGWIVEPD